MKKKKTKRQKPAPADADLDAMQAGNVEARGKFKKRVFSVSRKGKQFSRKARKPRQKVTRARREARTALESLNDIWRRLPNEKLSLWDLAAHLRIRRKNPEVRSRALIHISKTRISGNNFFVELNLLVRSCGFTKVIDAPPIDTETYKPLPLPDAPTIENIQLSGSKLVIGWVDREDISQACRVRIWLASVQKKFHKQLIGTVSIAEKKMAIDMVKAKRGEFVAISDLIGTDLLIQADMVDMATGLASDATNTYLFHLAK